MAISASATATGMVRGVTVLAYLVTIISLLVITARVQQQEQEQQRQQEEEKISPEPAGNHHSFEHIVGQASAKWSQIRSRLDTHDVELSRDDVMKELRKVSNRTAAPRRLDPGQPVKGARPVKKADKVMKGKWASSRGLPEPAAAVGPPDKRTAAVQREDDGAINTKTKESKPKKKRDPEKRLPDCLIIGARKAGTRAVLRFLRFQPKVKGIGPEIQFFSNPTLYANGLEWYREQMPVVTPGRLVVEKSAEYFHSWEAPERIHAMNPDIRLILVLREPYQRMVSDYYFLQRYARMINFTIQFDEVNHTLAELCINETTGEIREEYGALNRSKYILHLRRFLEWFPRKQIHIVDGDKLANSNPASEMRKVEQFLDLKPSIFTDDFFYFNETKGFFCTMKEGCLDDEKGHKFPDENPVFVQKIKEYFRPYNEMLYELLGINYGW